MSLTWTQHLIVAPILLPLLCGALMVPLNERHHQLKFLVNLGSVLTLFLAAILLIGMTDGGHWQGGIGVYLAANWAAPFGIALVADRLAAMMLLLTAIVATGALLYAKSRWSRIGVHFHSLFQFLLMGINGAFLTHDLFNLFVFFEVMLAASYGLLLHGYNATRLRAGLQYVAVNLLASLFFLIGVALIYASAGTLNMTDLAARLPGLPAQELALLKTGVAVLAVAFLAKSAMWPLGFWLPTTYAAASPPVAAMLVLMTKVGPYVILRLWLLAFSDGAGAAAGFAFDFLLWGGMATIVFGAAGMLASEAPGRLAGYGAIVSSGILLAVIGYGEPGLVGAGLYYLLGSTLALSAFMLLLELIERVRSPGAAVLAVTMEAFAVDEAPGEPVGVGIPAAFAFLGMAFVACALIMTGMPPLSGFVAKFGLFHALLNPSTPGVGVTGTTWALMALILLSGLAGIIGMMRFGVRTFWALGRIPPPHLPVAEVAPICLLLSASVLLTAFAGPVMSHLTRTAGDLHQRSLYIERVLRTAPVPALPHAGGGP